MLAFPLPPPDPLLRPCGTEILEFGLLIAAGAWKLRESKEASSRFVLLALALVGALFVLCPENSVFQRRLDRLAIGAVASLLEHPLRLFGIPVRAEGPALGEMVIVRGCFGPSYLAILALCAFAFPGRRIASAFVVALGMILLNAVRIEALYVLWWTGEMAAYDRFHDVGGFYFAAVALVLFCAATRRAPAGDPGAPAPGPRP